MKHPFLFAASAAVGGGLMLLGTGCEQAQEAKNAYSAIVTTSKAAKQMANNMEAAQARQEERKQHGDTVAISYKELQKFLPASPAGYTPEGGPKGQSTNMSGMHLSTAEQEYRQGDHTLKVALVDYSSAAPLFLAATAMMGSSMEMEDDDQLTRGLNLGQEGVKGLETLDKRGHRATVVLGINDRFLATVEASDQNDTELVKSIAKELALNTLAKR